LANKITKVMKYDLIYLEGAGEYRDFLGHFWDVQRKVREAMNKTIQICSNWDFQDQAEFKTTGNHLDVFETTGSKRLDGYVYRQLNDLTETMAATILNAAIQKSFKKYKDTKKQVFTGEISLPSYKSDQPVPVPKQSFEIKRDDNSLKAVLACNLFSQKYANSAGISTRIRFEIKSFDNTQNTILERVLDGTYRASESAITYDRQKKCIRLILTYSFEATDEVKPDKDKILGVDLGVTYAIYASSLGEHERLSIPGTKVIAFAKQMEARRRDKQKESPYCADGRIGHGTKTRVQPVYNDADKIARFRDTVNHTYSRALVDFAVKNGYGTIQLEDLTAVKTDNPQNKLLRHWTYFDLQTKITNKAKEHGIEVVKVNPQYTSQRCSRCGHIDRENRPDQAHFKCVSCGYSVNADFNASQNLSVKNIEKIIAKAIKDMDANRKPTE
jgi:IS605 OrfB family transposase